jgi:hypothetical protein
MLNPHHKQPRSGVKWAVLAVALGLGIVSSACAVPPGPVSEGRPETRDLATPLPTVPPPTEPLDIVLAWIECEDECGPQLQAVVRLGPEATPLLIRTVTAGAPPERLQAMQEHLARTYEELTAYGRVHPEAALSMEQSDYVGLYLDNYDALYRIRSAQALTAIGDPQALGAIQEALRSAEREDVREALQQALRGLG